MEIDSNETSIDYYKKIEDELNSKYRIEFELDKWDIERMGNMGEKIGEKATKNPELPTDNKEALQLVKEYYARLKLIEEIKSFLGKFYSWNSEAMEEKLSELNNFIIDAKAITLEKAFKRDIYLRGDLESQKIIYRRLEKENSYYDNNLIPFLEVGTIKVVYGKYFLFKELLEKKIGALSKSDNPQQIPHIQTNLTTDQRGQLFYKLVKGEFIPDENKDCFNWAIGVTDEKEPTQPDQWKPITWNKTKRLLSYFVDVFNYEILGNDGNKKQTKWKPFEIIFGQTGLRGAKNDYQKTGMLPEGNNLIDDIIKSVKSCK